MSSSSLLGELGTAWLLSNSTLLSIRYLYGSYLAYSYLNFTLFRYIAIRSSLTHHTAALKSAAYYCYPTTTVVVNSPSVVVEGEHPTIATYETVVSIIEPVVVTSTMPARAGKDTYNIIPNEYILV